MEERLHPPHSKDGWLGITNKYRGIYLSAIAAKDYNTLLLI